MSVDVLLAAIDAACDQAGISRSAIAELATGEIKRHEPGMIELAKLMGLPLRILDDAALKNAEGRTVTVSNHSLARTSTPSLSEAAALAAAGATSELIVARLVKDGATCALAQSENQP